MDEKENACNFLKNFQSSSHSLLPPVMAAYYYCNTCNVTPIEGARFHCDVCADYDECGKCRSAPESSHDASHTWTEHDEGKLSLSSDLGYALSLLNSCAEEFGHSVPYGPDKRSAVPVEELLLDSAPLCAFACMSASMGVAGLNDDIARVESILDQFRKLRCDFPGGTHIPCCRFGQQCPRCGMEMRIWTIMLRVSLFSRNVDLLAFFIAAEKKVVNDSDPRTKAMVNDGSFTADVLAMAWEEATAEEREAILSRKKAILDHLEQAYQWPLDLARDAPL
jgi:hypothetical protein